MQPLYQCVREVPEADFACSIFSHLVPSSANDIACHLEIEAFLALWKERPDRAKELYLQLKAFLEHPDPEANKVRQQTTDEAKIEAKPGFSLSDYRVWLRTAPDEYRNRLETHLKRWSEVVGSVYDAVIRVPILKGADSKYVAAPLIETNEKENNKKKEGREETEEKGHQNENNKTEEQERCEALDLLGGIFVLNLERRLDRKKEMEAELARCRIPPSMIEFIPAIEDDNGALGASKTQHVACSLVTLRKSTKPYLILEDDFELHVPIKQFWNRLRRFLLWGTSHVWSICNLTMHLQKWANPKSPDVPDFVKQVTEGCEAAGYLLHPSFAPILAKNLANGARLLAETGRHWEFALDQYWKHLQKETDTWYVMVPMLGAQRRSGACDTNTKPTRRIDDLTKSERQRRVDQVLSTFTGVVNNPTDQALFANDIPQCALNLSKIAGASVSPRLDLGQIPFRVSGGNASICGFTDGAGFLMSVRRNNWYNSQLNGESVLMNDNSIVVLDETLRITSCSLLKDSSRRKIHKAAQWRGFEDMRIYHATKTTFSFTSTTFENEAGRSPQIGHGLAVYEEDMKAWVVVQYKYLDRLNPDGEKNWLAFNDRTGNKDESNKTRVIYHWFPRFQVYELEPSATALAAKPIADFESPSIARLYEGSCSPIWWKKKKSWVAMVHVSTCTEKQPWGQFYHRFVLLDSKTFRPKAQSPLFFFCDDSINEYSCGMAWSRSWSSRSFLDNKTREADEDATALVISFGIGDKETRWVRVPLETTLDDSAFWTPLAWSDRNLANVETSQRWWSLSKQPMDMEKLSKRTEAQNNTTTQPSGEDWLVLTAESSNAAIKQWWSNVWADAEKAKKKCWLLLLPQNRENAHELEEEEEKANEAMKGALEHPERILVLTDRDMKKANGLHVGVWFNLETPIVLWWRWVKEKFPALCEQVTHVTFLQERVGAIHYAETLEMIPHNIRHLDFLAKNVEPWKEENKHWYWWDESRSAWKQAEPTNLPSTATRPGPPMPLETRWKCFQPMLRLSVRAINDVFEPLLGVETAFGEVWLPTACVRAGLLVGSIPDDSGVWGDKFGPDVPMMDEDVECWNWRSTGLYHPVKRTQP